MGRKSCGTEPITCGIWCYFQMQCQDWVELCCGLVARLLATPMDCTTPRFPVHHQLPELVQTHVHRAGDAIQPSHPVVPFFSYLQSFPASGPFPMSQFFASSGQSIGASASASVLLMNIQDWFPLGWTGWISLLNHRTPNWCQRIGWENPFIPTLEMVLESYSHAHCGFQDQWEAIRNWAIWQ